MPVATADALGDVPTSPKAQALCDLMMRPYTEHMAGLENVADRAAVLIALKPETVVATLEQGVSDVLRQYSTVLSPATVERIGVWLHEHAKLANGLHQSWEGLSGSSFSGLLRAASLGFKSEQTQLGAAIGSLFGPHGSAIGGAIGGLLALRQDNQRIHENSQAYLAQLTHWLAVASSDFDRRVLPRIERDLHPWPSRLRWATGILLLGAIAATCWHFLH